MKQKKSEVRPLNPQEAQKDLEALRAGKCTQNDLRGKYGLKPLKCKSADMRFVNEE